MPSDPQVCDHISLQYEVVFSDYREPTYASRTIRAVIFNVLYPSAVAAEIPEDRWTTNAEMTVFQIESSTRRLSLEIVKDAILCLEFWVELVPLNRQISSNSFSVNIKGRSPAITIAAGTFVTNRFAGTDSGVA